jgi:hypothetical protein
MGEFQPPVGVTFISPDGVKAADLSNLLCKTAAFIQSQSPYIKLERYDDWWEHDGLHFYRKSLSIEDLFTTVRSPKSLLESMPGDEDVFVGVYSKEFPLYLRFYVHWNEDETELIGRFDVTFPTEIAHQYRNDVVARLQIAMTEMGSEEYFSSIIL